MSEQEKQKPSLESLDKAIQAAKIRHSETEHTSGRSGVGDSLRIGIELVAGVIAGVLVGFWLDKWLGTSPLFFLSCFAFGVAGSGLNIYRMSKRSAEDTSDSNNDT